MLRKVCSVHDCIRYEVANGLCDVHRKRFERHGTVEAGRPKDWGERRKHPLYQYWKNMRRRYGGLLCVEWLDFWVFVRDVGGNRPSPKAFIKRLDSNAPFSPTNFEWKSIKIIVEGSSKKEYMSNYMKEWRQEDPDRFRNYELKKRFGITLDDYNHLLEDQKGVCAICSQPEKVKERGKIRALHVDHDHTTGKVRGLLCDGCNRGLGYFYDSIPNLESAIEYLRKHSS